MTSIRRFSCAEQGARCCFPSPRPGDRLKLTRVVRVRGLVSFFSVKKRFFFRMCGNSERTACVFRQDVGRTSSGLTGMGGRQGCRSRVREAAAKGLYDESSRCLPESIGFEKRRAYEPYAGSFLASFFCGQKNEDCFRTKPQNELIPLILGKNQKNEGTLLFGERESNYPHILRKSQKTNASGLEAFP
jgi:hypothetical protein